MRKLGSVIQEKLLLQAEEAREQGFNKLADRIVNAVNAEDENLEEEYSYSQLKEDFHRDLWKMAMRYVSFYDLESLDASKLDKTIIAWASKTMDEIEAELEVSSIKGAHEPKLPGESK
jgi:hypothetical protein